MLFRGWRALEREESLTLPGRINLYGVRVMTTLIAVLLISPAASPLLSGATLKVSFGGGEATMAFGNHSWSDDLPSLGYLVVLAAVWGLCLLVFVEVRSYRRRDRRRRH